jgi:exodeoxyribonuclease V alpha subunit
MARLKGTIERITFQSEETGFTVARLRPEEGGAGTDGLVTVVGETMSLAAGESVVMEGDWGSHAEYGRQFKIERYETVHPSTVDGVRRYLGSGLIKGIGPVMAKRIVDCFGKDALEVIEHEPGRLKEVDGLGPKRAGMITAAWKAQREIHGVMVFLQSHDVTTGHAVKIWKRYGQKAVPLLRENPYRLSSDVWGIGFLTADRIAQNMGIAKDSDTRVDAGISHVLSTASDDHGHVYLPRELIVEQTSDALGVDAELVESGLSRLVRAEEVVEEESRIYLPLLYYSEKGVATRLHQSSQISRIETGDVSAEIDAIEAHHTVTFAGRQREALIKALTHNGLVLTGGPGTGKTTTVRGLLWLLEARKKRVALAAPTGRAAKRMRETTGHEASTIHRLLGFKPGGGFEHDYENQLEIDAIIVDEISMVDVVLMNCLLRAVPVSASIILVGDTDQLPSVGPGSVLRDIIASGVVATVRLDQIFRQAQSSRIVMSAHEINHGNVPDLRHYRDSDFFFLESESPEEVAKTIGDLCSQRLPARYGVDPIDDIQVLSPMYRGETGANALNEQLQDRLNRTGQELVRGHLRLRRGDKVMQIRNNYDRNVYNGDIGRVRDIRQADQEVLIGFGDRNVTYDYTDLDEVVLAYAISVHKSQGSEFRAVVLPVTTQHYVMLQRNLIYTAITRARELVVIVGSKKALAMAVKNNAVAERFTTLATRLHEAQGSGDPQ